MTRAHPEHGDTGGQISNDLIGVVGPTTIGPSLILSDQKTYRTRSQAVGLVVLNVLVPAGVVDALVRGPKVTVGLIAASSIACVLGVVVFLRAALTLLTADEDGVKVRNPFRTVAVPWREIRSFEVGRYKILGCVLLIQRTNGEVLPAFAVQGITGAPRRQTSIAARAVAKDLNERGWNAPPELCCRLRAIQAIASDVWSGQPPAREGERYAPNGAVCCS